MSKNRFAGPAIAVIITIILIVWMISGPSEKPDTETSQTNIEKTLIPSVQVTLSQSRPVQNSLKINGVTQAKRSVNIQSEANGKVVLVLKEKGQMVQKGDAIVTLDQKTLPAQLRQAKAAREQTRLEYEGAQKLQGQGLQNQLQLAAALTSYEQAKAQLDDLERQQENTIIRAPFTGYLENIDLEPGSFVNQGETVATLYDYSELKFVGPVSEKDILSVKVGQPATVDLINGETVDAKVSYISTVTNPTTRTFTVELTASNADRNVSGVTSVAHINLPEAQGHFVSPALLYVDDSGEMGLKTLNSENEVVFFPVKILRSETKGVWISGLPDSANIITVGQGFTNIGDKANPTQVDFDSNVAVGL